MTCQHHPSTASHTHTHSQNITCSKLICCLCANGKWEFRCTQKLIFEKVGQRMFIEIYDMSDPSQQTHPDTHIHKWRQLEDNCTRKKHRCVVEMSFCRAWNSFSRKCTRREDVTRNRIRVGYIASS